MADTAVAITAGTGTNVDTRTEATNGNHRQVVVLGDPATNAGVAPVDVTNGLSVTLTTAIPAGTAAIGKLAANSGVDIGDVDVTTVPADPFGVNADAASATGSISAKLKFIASTGIPVTGSVAVTNAGLTELAAAINASSQMDVNIAASGATVPVSNAGLTALNGAISGTEVQVDVLTIAAGNNNIGDVDVASIAAGDNNIGNVDIASALPAGTNAIGKLAANNGVDIGDVDVTSIVLPRNLIGPGQPGTAVDSYTQAAFNLSAGNDQVLVSSAASKQIWVYGIGFTVNVAGTVSFQDEDNTAITGIMQIGATGGMTVSPSGNFSMPIWKLGTDKDLEVDVVTSELDGWICYSLISV